YFLELVAFPTFFPINHQLDIQKKNWSSPPGDHLVCNGPFKLKKWLPQTEILFVKNPTYWDHQAVHLDRIVFSVISNSYTESHLFEKGELDWLGQPLSNNITPEILGRLKEKGDLESYAVTGTCWLKFNTEKEPFNDAKLRTAFSYAINRQEIITHLLQGNQSIATGPVPPSLVDKEAPYFKDGDVAQARRLFEEVLFEQGWTLLSFPKIVLNYSPTERTIKIVQLVQQQWKAAFGIDVELVSLENHLYRRTVRQGLYQVGLGDWIADFQDPLAFLELFKYRNDVKTGNGMNDTGWQNEAFIALLDESQSEHDLKKREVLLNTAEMILVQEMPIAPIYHYAFDYVKKPYVQNVLLSPHGTADFKTTQLVH
ncbi:MAG TPA: peptide ABC transporter substrate-binding protein, partial [Waddliaceae bacterium]